MNRMPLRLEFVLPVIKSSAIGQTNICCLSTDPLHCSEIEFVILCDPTLMSETNHLSSADVASSYDGRVCRVPT